MTNEELKKLEGMDDHTLYTFTEDGDEVCQGSANPGLFWKRLFKRELKSNKDESE